MSHIFHKLVKSQLYHRDGLWKMFDTQVSDLVRLSGVVSSTAIWQYIWYGELQWKSYNEVDRTFYESIIFKTCLLTCLCFLFLSAHQRSAFAANKIPPLYELAISFNTDKQSLTGTAKITIPKGKEISLSLSQLNITGAFVQLENGTEKIIHTKGSILEFNPERQARTVYISYDRDVNQDYTNLISKEGISLTQSWYPYPSEPYVFKLSAQLPRGFSAITESDSFPLKVEDQMTKSTWSRPSTNINFVAGPYEIERVMVRDSLYVYSMFFHEDQELAIDYLDAAAEYIRKYEREIAPFPFNHYVVVSNRLPTGYGMPSFTLIGQMVLRLPFIKSSSLGHEIVHSWFGNDVEVDYEHGNWCEGLTSFLADRTYRAAEGKGVDDRKTNLIKYHNYTQSSVIPPVTLDSFRSASHNQPLADAKRAVGYIGGAFLFHELRTLLGEDVFQKGIRNFYLSNSGQSASWTAVQSSFEAVSKRNLQSFFHTRLIMKKPPEISATNISINSKNGTTLRFRLDQTAEGIIPLQIPIRVHTMSGEYNFLEQLNTKTKDVTLPLPDLPLSFTLDPEYTVLRQLTPEERIPVWSQFLGAEKKLVVLASEADRTKYASIIDSLKGYKPTVTVADSVTNQMLSENNLLFLGPHQPPCRSIFGRVTHNSDSLTVDVRKNPLHPGFVAVIVSDNRVTAKSSVARRLQHYGKYSHLEFKDDGSVVNKIATAAKGIHYQLEQLPAGGATNTLSEFDTIIERLLAKRVIYIGETHNSLPDHILQLRVIEALYHRDPRLAIGMEMFPMSSQNSLDEFTRSGSIMDEKTFLKKSDYFNVWSYDYRLFRDILNFAKDKNIPVKGINLDRKIVSDVFRAGNTDGLSEQIKATLVKDRDLDLPGYQERLAVVHNAHMSGKHGSGSSSGFIQSQALWDETMAANIVAFLKDNPNHRMVVLAGNQHTRKDSGIPPRVAARLPVKQASLINIYEGAYPDNLQTTSDYFFLANNIELSQSPKIGVVLSAPPKDSTTKGLTIDQISPHGKAGNAGLEVGDIIIRLNDTKITEMADLRIAMIDALVGEIVEVEVLRGKNDIKSCIFQVELTIPDMPKGHP